MRPRLNIARMTGTVVHDNVPIFRVVRRDWPIQLTRGFRSCHTSKIGGIRQISIRYIAVGSEPVARAM